MRWLTHWPLFTCLGWLSSPQRCTWQFARVNNEAIIHSRPQYSDIKSVVVWHAHSELFSRCILCYSRTLKLKLSSVTSVTSGRRILFICKWLWRWFQAFFRPLLTHYNLIVDMSCEQLKKQTYFLTDYPIWRFFSLLSIQYFTKKAEFREMSWKINIFCCDAAVLVMHQSNSFVWFIHILSTMEIIIMIIIMMLCLYTFFYNSDLFLPTTAEAFITITKIKDELDK